MALHRALQQVADVEVVAPEHNNSAKSNALTLNAPLYVHEAANGFRYVNGTPADCVHIALTGLLGYRPDLVLSGINNGANMGDALIPPFLIQRELAEKRLVIANERPLSSTKAYYLMIPERKIESASLQAFRDWLIKQAATYSQS